LKSIAWSVAVFLAIFIAIRHIQPTGILFYQGLATGAVITVAQFVFVRSSRIAKAGRAPTPGKDAVITFLLIYAFVFTVPTTVDRSYSVRMIGHLADAPDGLSRAEINQLYTQDFVDAGGVDKRLTEQSATGTIHQENGRYMLTKGGAILAKVFYSMEVVFDCVH
jgi:hypothetical protein